MGFRVQGLRAEVSGVGVQGLILGRDVDTGLRLERSFCCIRFGFRVQGPEMYERVLGGG